MSLLFNMLSRLVITFLPRRKHLLNSWLQSPSTVILEPRKMLAIVSTVSPSICHELMEPANALFQQHKWWLYTWTSPDGQYQNKIDYIFCSQRWRSSIQSAKTRLRADCGSHHEILTAKLRIKLKKVGKITSPFRYDLNQIPYNYTVEVTNRFKGLDLIDRVPE